MFFLSINNDLNPLNRQNIEEFRHGGKVKKLIKVLHYKNDASLRKYAVEKLGELLKFGDRDWSSKKEIKMRKTITSAVEDFALRDEDASVRLAAVDALGRAPSSTLWDPDHKVRRRAASYFTGDYIDVATKMVNENAVEELASFLDGAIPQSISAREGLYSVIKNFGEAVVDLLTKLIYINLKRGDFRHYLGIGGAMLMPESGELAIKLLGQIGDLRAVESLIAVLSETKWYYKLRDEAAAALRGITGENFEIDASEWQKWWEQKKQNQNQ